MASEAKPDALVSEFASVAKQRGAHEPLYLERP